MFSRTTTLSAMVAVAAVGIIGLADPAQAVVINNSLYCSAGANPATNNDTAAPVNLALTDVKLTIGATTYNSSNCYGGFAPANNGTATATGDINDIYKGALANPDFVYLDRTDEDSGAGLGGITFTITSPSGGATAGSYTVTWTDNAGGSDLPITVDLVVLLKAGSQAAAYLFDDLLLPVSPTSGAGTFDIQFTNPQNGNENGLSHIFMAGRLGTSTTLVPEPISLALLGSGLLGLALARRRK